MSALAPVLTRAQMLATLRTWQACAAGYLHAMALTECVEEYLTGLYASGALPANAALREHCMAARRWIVTQPADLQVDYRRVELAIHKSSLLARMLFDGEAPRTTPCPTHGGHWEGGFSPCRHGCGGTGWLPPCGARCGDLACGLARGHDGEHEEAVPHLGHGVTKHVPYRVRWA